LAPGELADLFIRSHGAGDENVDKRLITAKTKDGFPFAFRYQLTPSFMRMYLQHGMHALPQPVKMFTTTQVVSYEGGIKSSMALGVQTIGDGSEAVDAELIFLGCRILESLNLGTFTVRMNSIGDVASRQLYARALRDYYRSRGKKMCAKCRALTRESILMALECAQAECREINKEAPQMLDFLSEECKSHFRRLIEFLDEGEVPYIIDPHLMRHEDFAANTIFEFEFDAHKEGEEPDSSEPGQTVIRGGRWDRLAELVGGGRKVVPSAGWEMNLSVVVNRLKAKGTNVPELGGRPKVFLSQLGEAAKRKSLMLFEEIRKSGIEVRYSLSRDTIKGQLRMASRLGVKYSLIFGQKEALEGTVILREMETGIQETIPQEKIIDTLKKRLKRSTK
jgi:histidyl-tRNA synthetase